MRFVCLCPIWNHRHDTIQNAVQCFLDQTHREATLVLIDDRPAECRTRVSEFANSVFPQHILYLGLPDRQATLGDKYNAGLDVVDELRAGDPKRFRWDAIAIWDDDDGFLPTHLENAANAYRKHPEALWTYPDTVYTTFGGYVHTEDTGGRFWSSITFKRELLERMNGAPRFQPVAACGHDQMFLGAAKQIAPPVVPEGGPTYVYRWDGRNAENHTSGYSQGFSDTEWMEKTPYSCSGGQELIPGYDDAFKVDLLDLKLGNLLD